MFDRSALIHPDSLCLSSAGYDPHHVRVVEKFKQLAAQNNLQARLLPHTHRRPPQVVQAPATGLAVACDDTCLHQHASLCQALNVCDRDGACCWWSLLCVVLVSVALVAYRWCVLMVCAARRQLALPFTAFRWHFTAFHPPCVGVDGILAVSVDHCRPAPTVFRNRKSLSLLFPQRTVDVASVIKPPPRRWSDEDGRDPLDKLLDQLSEQVRNTHTQTRHARSHRTFHTHALHTTRHTTPRIDACPLFTSPCTPSPI